MNNKRIYIKFKNKDYEIEINPFHSIHHIIYDLYTNIIKKEIYFYENIYYYYLIKNKDYFLKVIEIKEENNLYLNPNCNIGLNNNYELIANFDIIILLNMITDYLTFIIKNIILTNVIIQYILLNIIKHYYLIEIDNKAFDLFNHFTYKTLSITLIIFTIMWIIILYIFFIKNRKK